MTLTISLPADAEARLRRLAEAAGKDMSAYAAELVAAAGAEEPAAIDGGEFQQLVRQWKQDTELLSSSSEMAMHPAYQRIMAMGRPALPWLLRELEREPDHWFWALKAITGQDPVPAGAAGNVSESARAWLEWARRNGIRW